MPNIDGLLARCPADFMEDMNFHNNMQRYFSSRGMKMPWLYYQADPIAAHIGGVSQVVGLKPDEQTFCWSAEPEWQLRMSKSAGLSAGRRL